VNLTKTMAIGSAPLREVVAMPATKDEQEGERSNASPPGYNRNNERGQLPRSLREAEAVQRAVSQLRGTPKFANRLSRTQQRSASLASPANGTTQASGKVIRAEEDSPKFSRMIIRSDRDYKRC